MTTDRLPETPDFLAAALSLGQRPGEPRAVKHVFELEPVMAVNTALATGRPLLVRGDPGVGKSQLARAVAVKLGRPFLPTYVSAQTQAQDLLWYEDAVTRLAEAQTFEPVAATEGQPKPLTAAEHLARGRFVRPALLWWALNWQHAERFDSLVKGPAPDQGGGDPSRGCVVLIDEIDKADASVPNGLLEVLGQGSFDVPGLAEPVQAGVARPLVILTTNEDRSLPDAFVRRCVVLHLRMPDPRRWPEKHEREDLIAWLVRRGLAHFGDPSGHDPELDALLRQAAEQLVNDREQLDQRSHYAPGLAEYIDLLEAALDRRSPAEAMQRIRDIARFVFHKHVDPGPMPEQSR